MVSSAVENLSHRKFAVFGRGVFGVLWFGLALGCSNGVPSELTKSATAPKPGQEPETVADLTSLRDTVLLSQDPPVRASSAAALRAAAKVFRRIDLAGMDRNTVLWILGDPATISDYGVSQDEGENAPMVYVFDSGFGSVSYTLRFEGGKVVEVIEQDLN